MDILFGFLVLLSIYLIYALHTYSKKDRIFEAVAFCTIEYPTSSGMRQWIDLFHEESDIPKQYRIASDDEWVKADEIIKEFQLDLIESYFKRELLPIKRKKENIYRRLFKQESIFLHDYFMIFLFVFLNKRRKNRFIGDHALFLNEDCYPLTEYGNVYVKLLYLSYATCIKKGIDGFYTGTLESIKRDYDCGSYPFYL